MRVRNRKIKKIQVYDTKNKIMYEPIDIKEFGTGKYLNSSFHEILLVEVEK